MSILEEIKNDYAKRFGFDCFEIMRQEQGIEELDLYVISKEYATECVKASLEKAYNNAEYEMVKYTDDYEVTKESITNPENIVLL